MSRYEDFHVGTIQAGKTVDGAFSFAVLEFIETSIDPASVPAATTAEQNLTFTGLKTGDVPITIVTSVAMEAVDVSAVRVDADDTLVVKFTNPGAAAIDIATGQTVSIIVMRKHKHV